MADLLTPLNFSPVSAEQWKAITAAVSAKAGVTISSNAGSENRDGIDIAWHYDGNNLSITVLKRSWFDPSLSTIDADIELAVNGVLHPS